MIEWALIAGLTVTPVAGGVRIDNGSSEIVVVRMYDGRERLASGRGKTYNAEGIAPEATEIYWAINDEAGNVLVSGVVELERELPETENREARTESVVSADLMPESGSRVR